MKLCEIYLGVTASFWEDLQHCQDLDPRFSSPSVEDRPHQVVSGPSHNNLPCRAIQYRTLRYLSLAPQNYMKLHCVVLAGL